MKVVIDADCSVDYTVRGSGPPILFIQGVGVQGDGWLPQTDVLSAHYTCITFDNRGVGKSLLRTDGELSVQTLAKDALAILADSGHQHAHIVGHSLGGTIALALALQARSAVRSLALFCTFPSGKLVAPLTWRMMWLGMRATVGTRNMRRRGFLKIVTPPGPLAEPDRLASRLSDLFGHDIADQPRIANRQLRALKKADLTAQLNQLSGLPTLIVSAQHDPIGPPKSGQAIAKEIQGSRFIEFPGASHGLPITHANEVNSLLREFLASQSAR
jgi:pimeloyl-ACP methyl ester carboxylesterase